MDAIWRDQPIFGFGADSLNPHPIRPIEAVGGLRKRELRDEVTRVCPSVPGVYGMLDRKGQLIYVGKSKALRSRLLSYFADSNAQEKGGRIIENTRAIQWETQPSEFAALLREQQLIRRFTPRWNVQGVPKRQRAVYLCLGRPPAAYFFLAAKPPLGCTAIEGPFYGLSKMQNAVDGLNKVFKLRDCSQKTTFHFREQLELFPLDHRPGCLRLEVGTCLGPCAAACSLSDYQMQVNAAESFVDGFNDEPLIALHDTMSRAAANQQYELASRAQQTLGSLEYVHRRLAMLAVARREYTFIYPVKGYDNCHCWYFIHSGEVADVATAPRTDADYVALKPRLKRWRAAAGNPIDRGHGAYPHTLALVTSWFRKNRRELKQTFAAEKANQRFRKQVAKSA